MLLPRRTMRGLPLALLFSLLIAPAAHADLPYDPFGSPQIDRDCSVALASEQCPRTRLALAGRTGVAEIDFPTTASDEVRGHGTNLHLIASIAPVPRYTFSLELPLAYVRLTHGADLGEDGEERIFTWGNLTLSVRLAEPLWTSSTRNFLATASFALALPIAQTSEAHALRAGRAQELARALDGYRRSFLFLPGYVTGMPSLGIEHRIRRFGATVQIDLPLAFRATDAGLGETVTRPVVLTPVLSTTGRVQATHWLELSLWTAGVIGAPPPLSVDKPARAFQLTMEPAASIRSRHHILSASIAVPLGGALGQKMVSGQLQSTVRW
jgi:hypothetical protein